MIKYGGLTVLCMLLSALSHQASASGNYVILAPRYMRAKHPYQLSIATYDFDGFSKLHLAIEQTSESDEPLIITKDVHLKNSQTQLVEVDTTTLPPGEYSINLLSGSGGEVNHTVSLTLLDKAYAVLVQTDKPIYKPGNVVKFRVLLVDQTTKPVDKPKAIRVTLLDPFDQEIKVWPYAMLRNGIFQSQLEISNEPNFGNWSIKATVYDKEHITMFQVDDYKLPKYEIRISTPKAATVEDRVFNVDIEAWYTFGRPVKGNATVTIKGPKSITKNTKINGNTRLAFNLLDLLDQQSAESENIPVEVNAVIRDQYTRDNIVASNSFHIYTQSYKLSLEKSSEHFIAGHPYRCVIQIKDSSGEQLASIGTHQAIVNIGYTGVNGIIKTVELRFTPDSDGSIPLTLTVPEQTTEIELDVSYRSSNERFLVHRSQGAENIQASIITERIIVNQPIVVQVQSSIPLNHLTYQVIAKGKIESIKKLQFDESTSIQFEIAATPEMIPNAKVFVFSFHDGRILKDTVPLMMSSLTNWVNVALSAEKVQPGERVQVSVESTPNSIVGLLAVDRGAWQLGDANQITKRRVLDEIRSFAEGIDDADDTDIMDMELITNAMIPTAVSARFGIYEPDEEDAYIPPRKQFPESWLWIDLQETGVDGKLNITDTVPESITSWEITAFSLSPQHGLGVMDDPVSLTVSKPFFILLNVPNSIKKSETAIVKVTLFNELNETSYVGVTLKNTRQEFEFVDNRGRKDASYQAKNVVLAANSASTAMFKIKPKKMGNIVIKVVAESTEASDSLEKLLRVTAESVHYVDWEKRFIELQDESKTLDLELKIPKRVDENSEAIYFSVQGDLLGDAIDGLEEMIRMPSGSGEQNVLKMVPNLVALDYMIDVGKINTYLHKRALKFLNMGYQNQLKFRRSDGSFSTFGKEDNTGSVFLTALVAKTLQQTRRFTTVDQKVVENAYNWLQQQQAMDGSFSEYGNVPEYGLQSKHKQKLTLTAYTLIAFLEDEQIAKKYKSVVDKGAQYLTSKIQNMQSKYTLALSAYAFQLAKYDQDYAFTKLVEVSHSGNDLRWWDDDATSTEATAYALLTYIKREAFVDSVAILNWLVSKRHLFGPDNIETTFVGLQAIAEHSKTISPTRNNYDVTVLSDKLKKLASINIDPYTSLTVQNVSLPSNGRKFKVKMEGTGTGVFNFHYQYKTNILFLTPRFKIKVETLSTSTSHYLDLKIGAKFIPSEAYEQSLLALMEITFPSGYIALDESVEELERMKQIRKVTTKYDDSTLLLYFESLPSTHFMNISVTGFRESEVLQQIPGSVRVFDFFDDSRVAIEHFDGTQLDVCSICDNECPSECSL